MFVILHDFWLIGKEVTLLLDLKDGRFLQTEASYAIETLLREAGFLSCFNKTVVRLWTVLQRNYLAVRWLWHRGTSFLYVRRNVVNTSGSYVSSAMMYSVPQVATNLFSSQSLMHCRAVAQFTASPESCIAGVGFSLLFADFFFGSHLSYFIALPGHGDISVHLVRFTLFSEHVCHVLAVFHCSLHYARFKDWDFL